MRVSTAGQEEQTIDNQKTEVLRRIEKDKNVLLSDCIYQDDGWSGSILKRPDLDRLRADAKDGKFEILYYYDRGRVSRIFIHQEIIIGEIRKLGIECIGLYDINGVSDEERLMGSVMGIFHEYERLKIAERMRIGKIHKVRENKKLLGYQPKYGYDYLLRIKKGVNARDGSFIINKERAKVVCLIFQWCADGMSKHAIQKELYKRGVAPQKGKRETWSTSVIDRLLRDTTYKGVHYYNKSESVETKNPRKIVEYSKSTKGSRVSRPKDEWLKVEVPAIVDVELFNKVQIQLVRNKRTYDRQNGRTHNYLVGGIVECPCGFARTGDPAGNHSYYRCNDRLSNPHDTRKCFEHGVNATVLDTLIWDNIKKLLTNPELVFGYAQKWQSGASPLQARLEMLDGQLKELDEKEKRVSKVYAEGIMAETIYKDNVHEIDERRRIIVDDVNGVKDELVNKPLIPLEKLVEGVIKLVEGLDFSNKREIIHKIVSKVVATKEEVTVWGYIPVLATGEVGSNVKYSNCRTTECRQIYLIQCPDK